MINYLIKLIIRRELNKIDAHNEAMFYNILCNKYNKGEEFDSIKVYGKEPTTDIKRRPKTTSTLYINDKN